MAALSLYARNDIHFDWLYGYGLGIWESLD